LSGISYPNSFLREQRQHRPWRKLTKWFFCLLGILIVLSLASNLCAATQDEHKLHVGSPAPKIEVTKWIKGAPIDSFEAGSSYVVEFWSTTSTACKAAVTNLTYLSHHYKKVTFIGVSIDEKDQRLVRPYVEKMWKKMEFHVAIDKQTSFTAHQGYMAVNWVLAAHKRYVPLVFVVGNDGNIAWIGEAKNLGVELQKLSF